MKPDRHGDDIKPLRGKIDAVNRGILDLLRRRGALVRRLGEIKAAKGWEAYDPGRELEQLAALAKDPGPYSERAVRRIFNEILSASREILDRTRAKALKVLRSPARPGTAFAVRDVVIGERPLLIAGPCAVEDAGMLDRIAARLARRGVRILRGGAHKPRTSPYSFQGMGDEGYRILKAAAERHGMVSVSEVLDERSVEAAAPHIDILQIGMRNMSNQSLLKAVRRTGKPVLLKRNFAATYDELLLAAEYLAAETDRIILCERGIRTFERGTRSTLDISAVPVLRAMSHLPVCVDVSHAAGRSDILAPLARAAFAAGAHAVMVEVHPEPARALCDSQQQLSLEGFDSLCSAVGEFLHPETSEGA